MAITSANPFAPNIDFGAPLPPAVTGAMRSATRAVLPGMFPLEPGLPTMPAKGAETQAAIQAGKTKAAAAEAQNAGPAPAPKADSPFTTGAEWTGEPGFRWKGPATTTQAGRPTQYRGTHDPSAVRNPFGGPSSTTTPEGFLFDAAGTAGQAEADARAEEGINARHRQALEAIALDEAMRPDPMASAVERAKSNAAFEAANVFEADPFAERRFITDETVRAEREKAGIGLDTEAKRRAAYQTEVETSVKAEYAERLGALKASPEYQRLDPSGRAAAEANLARAMEQKRQGQLGRAFAFGQQSRQKAAYEDPFATDQF